VPIPDPVVERQRRRIVLQGDVPSPMTPPSGCAFHPRCPYAFDLCRTTPPALAARPGGRDVACHLPALDPPATTAAPPPSA
jgi:oligopeptide/dipeptide ABC transporter ATP-binding protein